MSNGQNSSTQSQTTTGQPISSFTDHEKDVTGYLFAKLIVLYANSFYLVYPSEKEVVLAKREYAKQIGEYSRDQIDIGIRHLARLAISRERDDRIYREPNIPAILAMLYEVAKPNRSHKLFLPVPTESAEDREKRYSEGEKHSAAILAMFAEEEPPTSTLTPAQQAAEAARLERIKNKF